VQVGINYDGSGYDNKDIPYRIVPATSGLNPRYNDLFGRNRFLDILKATDIDIVFLLNDMSVTSTFFKEIVKINDEKSKNKKFVTIFYTPVDSPLTTKEAWIKGSLSLANYHVTYTEYAKKMIEEVVKDIPNLGICYHGIDLKEFYPITDKSKNELRKELFGGSVSLSDKFIITNVNRNQIRKDYLKTFQIFSEIKKKFPQTFLFAMAAVEDQGGNLIELGKQFGLEYRKDWLAPENYSNGAGYPVETVNAIYNMSDCIISTSHGEGWGLSSTEALATKIPCLFPNNTSLTEIFGGDGERGRLIDSGKTPDNYVCYGANDSSIARPSVNVRDAVIKLGWIINGSHDVEAMVNRGYEWVKGLSWDIINKFWLTTFEKAIIRMEKLRGIH
jgi:glycosyltransferase involved in cell wall biosynthesis